MAKILDIYGKELWSDDKPTVRESLVAAVGAGAYLTGADLAGANLAGADLAGANLARADLTGAYLAGAYLTGAYLARADLAGADLARAYLAGANLTGAYLAGADLARAYLAGADLAGANLAGADLAGADLAGAYLTGAYLTGAKGINPHRTTPLLMLHDQPGLIRAYKLVNEDGEGHVNGGLKYVIGESVEVADANTNVTEHCAAGVNVATLDWCMHGWRAGYRILVVEFTAADIAAIPTATDGKFRLFRCKVVGEKDLREIGLVQK